jgi:hypothetical protein
LGKRKSVSKQVVLVVVVVSSRYLLRVSGEEKNKVTSQTESKLTTTARAVDGWINK